MQEISFMRISILDVDQHQEIIDQAIECGKAGYKHVYIMDFDDPDTIEAIVTKEELSVDVKIEIDNKFVIAGEPWGYDKEYELPDTKVKLVVI